MAISAVVHACIDLQVALSQAVKGGQQVGIASVQALVQACACCSIVSAAHDCRHIPAWPVVAPKCVLRQHAIVNSETRMRSLKLVNIAGEMS